MQLSSAATFKGHKGKITCLAAGNDDPRSRLLLSGSEDKTCRLWDVRTSKASGGILGFGSEVIAAEFAGDRDIVAVNGSEIRVFDQRSIGMVASADKALACVDTGGAEVQAISTRGEFIAYVDEDGHLGVLDYSEQAVTKFTGKHAAVASCVGLHPQKPEIATGGFDGQILVWDMASEAVKSRLSTSVEGISSGKSINPPFTYTVDFSPFEDESVLVSGHADGRIMCFKDEGATLCWLDCHSYSISALRFVQSNPQAIASAGLDRALKIWDADELLYPAIGSGDDQGPVVAFSEDPPVLASVSLGTKPDALATSLASPTVYVDQDSSIAAFEIV